MRGVRFVTSDRAVYDPTRAATAALIEARRLAGADWEWVPRHFDRLAGTTRLRAGIEAGADLEEVVSSWGDELAAFLPLRARFLLY